MKTIYTLFLLTAISVTASAQSVVSSQTGGFTLEITANHVQGHYLQWDFANTAEKIVTAGATVVVATRKTNISNHEIMKFVRPGWIWDVRDSSGNPVGPNKSRNPGGWIAGGGSGVQIGSKDMYLQPGEATTHSSVLGRFDLSQPGTYTVQVSQHTSDDPNSPVVQSNTNTITMLPAEAPSPNSDNAQPPAQSSGTQPFSTAPNHQPRTGNTPSLNQSAHPAQYATLVPAAEKPRPAFTLSIEEDKTTAQSDPTLHRLLVTLATTPQGIFVNRFHPEAQNMYDMVVTRDGVPAQPTSAMLALEQYRKVDRRPTIQHPFVLKSTESLTMPLDVSDYYDMTRPGTYQVTVTRQSQPLNLAYSTLVKSNTISIVVPPNTAAISAAAAQKPQPRFDLNIAQEDPDEVPPTMIRIEMENTSNTVIRIAKCWPFLGMFNFSVIRDGEPLEENDDMRRLQKSRAAVLCPGNDTLNEIQPGDTYAEDMPLGNFYDISQPGVYFVYVTRKTYPWNPAKSIQVESNTISFTVPQSPAEDTLPSDGSPTVQQ